VSIGTPTGVAMAILVLVAAVEPAEAQQQAPTVARITLAEARTALDAAEAEARRRTPDVCTSQPSEPRVRLRGTGEDQKFRSWRERRVTHWFDTERMLDAVEAVCFGERPPARTLVA
jgi:hypothetical protein